MPDVEFQLSERLLQQIEERGVVFMVGAGASAAPPTNAPGWYALNKMILAALGSRLERYLDRSGATAELQTAINDRRTAHAFPPDYQAEILHEACGEHYFRAIQSLDLSCLNEVHRGIAWLAKHGKVRAIVTTNFDCLLEKALGAYDVKNEAAYDSAGYARCLAQLQGSEASRLVSVLKVHGSVQDHLSLIDTLKQRLKGRNVDLDQTLRQLLDGNYWIYGGFSAADLETDPDYLQVIPGAHRSTGITYLQWPGADLRPGATRLLQAYGEKATLVSGDLVDFLRSLCTRLGLAPWPSDTSLSQQDSRKHVEAALEKWADGLHPAAVVNGLAGLAEANGEAVAAFRILHRFWKDVLPSDREGPDFERYRLNHGRLGMGRGLLSLVEDMELTKGEESIQNLYRVASSGDPRGDAWAGLAWIWAGNVEAAMPFLLRSGEALDQPSLSPEHRVDIWITLAEALYILLEPRDVVKGILRLSAHAAEAGDLPRQARVMAMGAFYIAEFLADEYPAFLQDHAGPVFSRAARLNDPEINGFAALAEGRFRTKRREGQAALDSLYKAADLLAKAGRPPWRTFALIEFAKALMDEQQVAAVARVFEQVNEVVDRHQVLLCCFLEAKGQCYRCVGQDDDATASFTEALDCATTMGLSKRAEILRKYLAPPSP